MTMFVEQQSSPIPTNQSLEKKNEGRSPMSPLSEEIRQRAARWRKIRDNCPDLTVSPDGQQEDVDDVRSTQEGDQQEQQHKQQTKPRRAKKRAGRLRYSDMINSKLGESWHPESESSRVAAEQQQQKPATPKTNHSKETTRVKNRRNLFQKIHSVPDFSKVSSLEVSLQKVPGASMKKPQGEDATLDETIDSLRPFSEIRINPSSQRANHNSNKSVGASGNIGGRAPNKSLDDFLDSLIFDARKSRIDAATMSVGSKPRRTRSSRDSRSISSKELHHQATIGNGGKISSPHAAAVGTVSGDRVSLTFVSDDNEDKKKSALDPPQVVARRKSSSSGGPSSAVSSSRGKDPPGKVKRPGALGGFLDKGRKKRPGRPTAAATVAGDQVAGRLKSQRSRGSSKGRNSGKSGINEGESSSKSNGKAGNSARSILDALLSPRKSSNTGIPEKGKVTSKAASAALGSVSPGTLKRAYSMSVMGQGTIMESDTIRTGDTDILSDIHLDDPAAGSKKGKKKGGAQLGSFLDRRRQPHSRKSGANTVAGDRVAVRHTKSMGRSTREVLKRLEADKKGELQRMASESTGTKTNKTSRNSDSWVPRRSLSNAGVESSSVAARLRLQQIESAATSEESDVIEDSERMFDRSADKSTDSNDSDFEEAGFDPHCSTSQLDLEGFWDRKNSRSLRGRKPEGNSISGRRSSRGRSGKRPSRKTGRKKGDRNMRYTDSDVQSSVFGESWRRPRSQSKNSKDQMSAIDVIGSMLEPEGNDNTPSEDNSGRRPRADNNAATTKQLSRRRMLKKVQSLSSLGVEKTTSGDNDLGSAIRKKSKSGRKSPTAGLVGIEKQSDKGPRGRSSALAEEIYIREDGKKVRRVHRKAIDGEILTRPDGKKVRIRRKNRISKGNSAEIQSKNDIPKEEPKKKSKSWLDQYLNGDDIPMASGHTRPRVGRSLSGTIDTAHARNTDAKPLSLRKLRDSETTGGPVLKPQSLRVARNSADSGSDSSDDAPPTPLSVKDRRNMFRKINSVPALMAASPLVNLYEKKPNDVKDRIRRTQDAPDSPGKDKTSGESGTGAKRTRGSPTRKKKALSVQGGNMSLGLLDLYDKDDVEDSAKPGSLRLVGDDAAQIVPSNNKSAMPDANGKNPRKGEACRPRDKAERAEDKKRQLLLKSSKLRKVQSLSNLGHRQYDLADRHLLVERLKTLNNDARLTPLRSRPTLDTSETVKSKTPKDTIRSPSRERAATDAKRSEVLTPNTLRRLRKVSSHSDISSITRQSSHSQAEVSKALQFARWKSPAEKTAKIAVKSPKRRLSNNSSAGSLERNMLAKSGIPSIDLDFDISPGAEESPARPGSARTMGSPVTAPPSSLRTLNSGSTPTPPTSSRTLNSETGSKKEAPPDLPMRKQSLHPGEAERAVGSNSDATAKGQPPLVPRKKDQSQPITTLPPRSTTPTPNQVSEKDLKGDRRPSLLNLGPPQSPFRRSLARWSSVPKDLGSTVNSSSLTKDEAKGVTKTSEEKEQRLMHSRTVSKDRTDESSSKSRGSAAQFPAPGSQLLVYDDASTVCSDITDCWTNEIWLAAESRRRAAGHNRRNTYDLGSIINEETGAEGSSRFERSPLQMNRWESASKLIKDGNESLPTPRRPTDDNAPKGEEAAKRFGWLKNLSFPPRGKSSNRSDEGALLDDQSQP